jgi:hypothetical protein
MANLKTRLKKFREDNGLESQKAFLIPLFIVVFIIPLFIVFNNKSSIKNATVISQTERDESSNLVLTRVDGKGIFEVIEKSTGNVLQKISVEDEDVQNFAQSADRFYVVYTYLSGDKLSLRGYDFEDRTYATLGELDNEPMKLSINNLKTMVAIATEDKVSVVNIADGSYKTVKEFIIYRDSETAVAYIPEPYWDPEGKQLTIKIRESSGSSNPKAKTYLINVVSGVEILIYEGVDAG